MIDLRSDTVTRPTAAMRDAMARASFMEHTLAGRPIEDFPVPSNIVFVPVDKKTGDPAVSGGGASTMILEAFIAGSEPTGYLGQ